MESTHGLRIALIVLILCGVSALAAPHAVAQTGATVAFQFNSTKSSATPGNRNDTKGTISTVILSSEQQNQKWKAYVGNVSGTFVLDDASDYSIYQWTITSFTGQVYITRNNSINWNNVACANVGNKTAEDTAINHTSTSSDSVNSTFTSQVHRSFSVGSTSITGSTCFATRTYQNNTAPGAVAGTVFEEVLLSDSGSHLIYTTFVESNQYGYNRNASSQNITYDFQAIIPDSGLSSAPAIVYYFYLELLSS